MRHTMLSLSVALLLAPTVYAQEAPVAIPNTSTSSMVELDRVTVVGVQKRPENAQTVPLSMTVNDSWELKEKQISHVQDLAQTGPNMTQTQANGLNTFTLRGIGGGGRNIGFDPRVGVYIDGIYAGQAAGLSQTLLGIDQAVVLRGPQGTIFGRNNVAGAIVLTSTPPPFDTQGEIKVGLGNNNARMFEGNIGGAVGPARGILHAQVERRDGYLTNAFSGQDLDNRHRHALRGQVVFDPSSNTSIALSADHSNINERNIMGSPRNTFFGLPKNTLHKEGFSTTPKLDVTLQGASVRLTHKDASSRTWTLMGGTRHTEQFRVNDTDYSSLDLVHVNYVDDNRLHSLEARVNNPGSARSRYLIGVYVSKEQSTSNRQVIIGKDLGAPIAFPGRPQGLPFGLVFGLRKGLGAEAVGQVDTNVAALFGQWDYDVSSKWTVHLGARASAEHKDMTYLLDGTNSGRLGLALASQNTDSRSSKHVTPSLGVSFKPAPHHLVYLKHSQGYKSGGWNLDFLTQAQINQGIGFDDETVNNLELGYKGEIGALAFDATIFDTRVEDYQVFQFVPLPTGGSVSALRNAASARVRGVELQAKVRLNDHVKLYGSLGKQSAKFEDFPGGEGGRNLAGNHLPDAPNTTAQLGLHTHFGASDQWKVDVNMHNQGKSFAGVENKQSERYRERTTANAQVSWRSAKGVGVSVFAKNIGNSQELQYQSRDFFGHEVEKMLTPRMYGVEVSWQF